MSTTEELARRFPALAPLLAGADHVDVKRVEGAPGMRAFIARMLSYQPGWLRSLYAARWFLVRLLGMRQQGLAPPGLAEEAVSLRPGDAATFFTVTMAEEERFWVAEITESHLTAYLAVLVEPLAGRSRFHVATIVRYRRWTGPVYFNLIRPFHHLVVRRMMRAAVRGRVPAGAA